MHIYTQRGDRSGLTYHVRRPACFPSDCITAKLSLASCTSSDSLTFSRFPLLPFLWHQARPVVTDNAFESAACSPRCPSAVYAFAKRPLARALWGITLLNDGAPPFPVKPAPLRLAVIAANHEIFRVLQRIAKIVVNRFTMSLTNAFSVFYILYYIARHDPIN